MDRFWNKVNMSSGDCWLWAGARLPNGYGSFMFRGRYTFRSNADELALLYGVSRQLIQKVINN